MSLYCPTITNDQIPVLRLRAPGINNLSHVEDCRTFHGTGGMWRYVYWLLTTYIDQCTDHVYWPVLCPWLASFKIYDFEWEVADAWCEVWQQISRKFFMCNVYICGNVRLQSLTVYTSLQKKKYSICTVVFHFPGRESLLALPIVC